MSRPIKGLFALLVLFIFSALGLSSCGEDCGVCPQQPVTQDIVVPADEYGEFCPVYHSGTGDYDFEGNGPDVFFEVEVYVTGDSLMFNFFVDAIETQADWTRGAGRWDELIYQAPEGWRISAVDTPIAENRSYTDTNHEMDFIHCGDFKFRGYGDRDGDDIGASGCVSTWYWVWIRDINVEITREE